MNARKRQMRKTMNTIERRRLAADLMPYREIRVSFDEDPWDPWADDYDWDYDWPYTFMASPLRVTFGEVFRVAP